MFEDDHTYFNRLLISIPTSVVVRPISNPSLSPLSLSSAMRKRQSGLPLHNSPPPQDWDLIESGGSPSTPWNASTSKEFSPKKRKKDTSLWISLGVFVVMLVVLVVIVVVKKRGHRLDVGSGAGSFTG